MIGELISLYRRVNDIPIRDLAEQIGVNHSTLHRVEKGGLPDSLTMLAIINWLFKEKEEQ